MLNFNKKIQEIDTKIAQSIKITPISSKDYTSPTEFIWFSPYAQTAEQRTTFAESANLFFSTQADTNAFYQKDGELYEAIRNEENNLILRKADVKTLTGTLDPIFISMKHNAKGELVPTLPLKEDKMFCAMKKSDSFKSIKSVKLISPFPIYVKSLAGAPYLLSEEYEPETQKLALGRLENSKWVTLEEAKTILNELFVDILFQTPSDRARCIAAFMTPALFDGGWIESAKKPINIILANATQAGKGHLCNVLSRVYGEAPLLISDADSHAGNLDNMIAQAVRERKRFISIDNLRGTINSPSLEAFLTAPDKMCFRSAYCKGESYSPTDYDFSLTSNGVRMTLDILNRSNVIRIIKQPSNYVFKTFDGMKIEDYLSKDKNNQRFLMAIFSIIQEWVIRGEPKEEVTQHDNRSWACVVESIVHKVLGEASLFDDYDAIRAELCENRNTLEDILIQELSSIEKRGPFSASEITEIINNNPLLFKSFFNDKLPTTACTVGVKLRRVFKKSDKVGLYNDKLERIKITRNYENTFCYQLCS